MNSLFNILNLIIYLSRNPVFLMYHYTSIMHTYIVSYLYLQELNLIEVTLIRVSYNFNLPCIAVKYNNLQNSKAIAKNV